MLYQYVSMCLTYPMPYLKAMDIFVGICSCFSIISLLESTIIAHYQNLEDQLCDMKKHIYSQIYPMYVHWIELGIKIAFPVFFIFFVSLFGFLYVQ